MIAVEAVEVCALVMLVRNLPPEMETWDKDKENKNKGKEQGGKCDQKHNRNIEIDKNTRLL